MPVISVIIPTYNAERTILETITSVQKQTFSDFELLLINDGSSDRTLELLQNISDERLQIFSYENAGVSVARNRGIAHATGEVIAFLDADDLWTPDKLELQVAALQQHPQAGVAYSWTYIMDEKGKSFHVDESIFFEGDVYVNLLVRNFICSGSNSLIRRQAIESVGEFDPTLTHGEDWEFYLRLAADWPFVVVPKAQILYRQTSGSASSKVEVMEKGVLRAVEKVFIAVPKELQYLKNQNLANFYQYLTGICLTYVTDVNQLKQAGQKLQMAIRLYPKTLLDRTTQRYVLKWLLMRLLSPKVARYLTRPFGIARAIRAPSLK